MRLPSTIRGYVTGILLSLLAAQNIKAQTPPPYPFDGATTAPIQEHYLYLCDSSNALTPAQAFQAFARGKGRSWTKGSTFNQGFTPYRYWFLLSIRNDARPYQEPFLRIASVIYQLAIYQFDQKDGLAALPGSRGEPSDTAALKPLPTTTDRALTDPTKPQPFPTTTNTIHTGPFPDTTGQTKLFQGTTSLPYNQRPFRHREFVLPLDIRQGDSALLLIGADYRDRNMRLVMDLTGYQQLFTEEVSFSRRFGIYLGIMIFILIFNIFLYFTLKDPIHGWYVVYLVAVLVYAIFDYNMDRLLVPGASTVFSDAVGGLPFDELLVAAALKFMQVFIRQEKGKLYYLVSFFIYSSLAIAIFYLATGIIAPAWLTRMPASIQPIFSYHTIIAALMIPVSCIPGLWRRHLESIMYLISSSMPVAGGVVYFLYQMGFIVDSAFAKDAILIGITIEVAILSIYLVQRYHRLKKEKEKLLIDLHKNEQDIATSIVNTVESERRRIAQDLHDEVGATLGALSLHISNIPKDLNNPGSAQDYSQKALFLTNKAAVDIRNISHDMLPQDYGSTGLFTVLQTYIDELNQYGKMKFRLITDGPEARLSHIYSITIYRITRELILNILRHSKATTAVIQVLVSWKEAIIMAEDNGVGMDNTDREGIGLKNIRSRTGFLKGKINIDSSPKGTTIIVSIPLGL